MEKPRPYSALHGRTKAFPAPLLQSPVSLPKPMLGRQFAFITVEPRGSFDAEPWRGGCGLCPREGEVGITFGAEPLCKPMGCQSPTLALDHVANKSLPREAISTKTR